MATRTLRRRDLYRAARRAMHERWCGTPPSCGYVDPCSQSQIDTEEVRAAVAAVMDELRSSGYLNPIATR